MPGRGKKGKLERKVFLPSPLFFSSSSLPSSFLPPSLAHQDNNIERAADWVFSHAAELDTERMDTEQEPPATAYLHGPGSMSTTVFSAI